MSSSYIPKVSIIVPVYNAGEYIYRCLDSLVNQTLREIEIIIVLDCPTDGTDNVVEEYARKDNRIVVLRNEMNLNIGLSRNEGLKIAKGEYIGFSDHDDYSESNMYELLYNETIDEHIDIVISPFGYDCDNEINEYFYPNSNITIKEHFDLLIGYDHDLDSLKPFVRNGGIWNKLFKRTLIIDNKIFFQDNRLITFEDLLFLVHFFSVAKDLKCVNKTLYYHVQGINNTARSYKYYSYPLIISYLNELKCFLHRHDFEQKFLRRFNETVVFYIISSILNEFANKAWYKINPFFIFKLKKNSLVVPAFKFIQLNDLIYNFNNPLKKFVVRIIFCIFRS